MVCSLQTDTNIQKVIDLNKKHLDSEISIHPTLFDNHCDSLLESKENSSEEQLDDFFHIHESKKIYHQRESNSLGTNDSPSPGPLYYVNLLVGENPCLQPFLIDSGSSITTLQLRNLKLYCNQKSWHEVQKKIKKNSLQVLTAAGQIWSIGEISLPVYLNNETYNLCFRIMDDDQTPNILGVDSLYILNGEIDVRTGALKLGGIPVPTSQEEQQEMHASNTIELSPQQLVLADCKVSNLYTNDNLAVPTKSLQHNMIPQLLYCNTNKVQVELFNDTDTSKVIKKGEKIGNISPYYSVSQAMYPLIEPTNEDIAFMDSLTCNSLEECKKSEYHRHSVFEQPPFPQKEDIIKTGLLESRINSYLQEKLKNQTSNKA